MSFTDLADATAYGDTTNIATITFDPAALTDVVAGDLIVMFWDVQASSVTVSSCSDNGGAGQVYDITSCTPKSGGTHSCGWVLCKANGANFGTAITITLSASNTRRSGTLVAFHASNHNPVLDAIAGSQTDTASPVDTSATGTLAQSDELGVVCFGARCPLTTASGYSQTTPASGWTQASAIGTSGGSGFVETRVAHNVNIGSTTSFTAAATFTSLTNCHSWLLTFTDQPITPPPTRVTRPKRTWAGR